MMSADEYGKLVVESHLVPLEFIQELLALMNNPSATAEDLAFQLVANNLLSRWQAKEIANGRGRNLVLANRYQVQERIAIGGMASVYRALDTKSKLVVALKVPRRETMASPVMLARFHREVIACAKLNHPNIVRTLDSGIGGGIPYLVLELLEGIDLATMLKRDGPFAPHRAVEYMVGAAQALSHTNKQGIIHRDLKPSNIMLTDTNVIKLLDLGMVRLINPDEPGSNGHGTTDALTAAGGAVIGSGAYVAPEQIQDARLADIRSDIYSLGCTFYELLSGHPPFEGATALAIFMKGETEPIPPIPDLDPLLKKICWKMLARSPAERYQDPEQVLDALRYWQLENLAMLD